jgi:hypothetical protein
MPAAPQGAVRLAGPAPVCAMACCGGTIDSLKGPFWALLAGTNCESDPPARTEAAGGMWAVPYRADSTAAGMSRVHGRSLTTFDIASALLCLPSTRISGQQSGIACSKVWVTACLCSSAAGIQSDIQGCCRHLPETCYFWLDSKVHYPYSHRMELWIGKISDALPCRSYLLITSAIEVAVTYEG